SVLVAQDLTVTHNGFGSTRDGGPEYSFAIAGDRLRATNVTVSDNAGFGIYVNSFKLIGSSVTGNGNFGADTVRTAILVDSTVTGNNGFGAGYDLTTGRRPRLVNSSCGRSATNFVPPPATVSWGVCSLD